MKKYLILVFIALLMGALFVGVLAAGPSKPAGESNTGLLYLYEKDGDPDWNIVEGGAWGKMKYNLSGEEFEFVFNGHGLVPDTGYTLIYWPEQWPNVFCLGNGTTDEYGDVHIMCLVDIGDLIDAKIWLVPSNGVNCEDAYIISWNPTEYLFEEELITFDDTDEQQLPELNKKHQKLTSELIFRGQSLYGM